MHWKSNQCSNRTNDVTRSITRIDIRWRQTIVRLCESDVARPQTGAWRSTSKGAREIGGFKMKSYTSKKTNKRKRKRKIVGCEFAHKKYIHDVMSMTVTSHIRCRILCLWYIVISMFTYRADRLSLSQLEMRRRACAPTCQFGSQNLRNSESLCGEYFSFDTFFTILSIFRILGLRYFLK